MRQGAPNNPYSSIRLGPDGTDYWFASDELREQMIATLARSRWNAWLVGRHGAGKTTLARTLLHEAETRGMRVVTFKWSEQTPRLPRTWHGGFRFPLNTPEPVAILFLDGAERMSRAAIDHIRSASASRGFSLIATLHAPPPPSWLTLPDTRSLLHRLLQKSSTQPHVTPATIPVAANTAAFQQIIARLEPQRAMTLDECETRLARHSGNMRDALFELYDEHEAAHAASLL